MEYKKRNFENSSFESVKFEYFVKEKEVLRFRHDVEGVEGVTGPKDKQGIELAL